MRSAALKILHIEDDSLDGEIVEEMLKESFADPGCLVCRIDTLREALDELSENKFDIILLDLVLAETAGMDNVLAVRNQAPNTPVIILTGIEDDRMMKKALEAGARRYLFKAYESARILKDCIASTLEENSYDNILPQLTTTHR